MKLTLCARCNQPRGDLIEGTCGQCRATLRGKCRFADCDRPHAPKKSLCHSHYDQRRRGNPLTVIVPRKTSAEIIEDVEWIVGTDTAERIAARVDSNLVALERMLYRAGRGELWLRLTQETPARLHTHRMAS